MTFFIVKIVVKVSIYKANKSLWYDMGFIIEVIIICLLLIPHDLLHYYLVTLTRLFMKQ